MLILWMENRWHEAVTDRPLLFLLAWHVKKTVLRRPEQKEGYKWYSR